MDSITNGFKQMILSHDEHELSSLLDLPSPTEIRSFDFSTPQKRNQDSSFHKNGKFDQVDHGPIQYAFGSRIPTR